MKVSQLALVQGMDDTRATLRRWNDSPVAAVRPWALGAARDRRCAPGERCSLVGHATEPDATGYLLPGLNTPATYGSVGHVLFRNSLVLALHAMACVAGFIAGSSLPLQAEHHSGWWRTVHEKAGPAAIAFVGAATVFSLGTQAYVLGSGASTISGQLDIGAGVLMLTLLPHALPELFALFLPLAAWMRRQPPWRLERAAGGDRGDNARSRCRCSCWRRASRSSCGRTCCGWPRRRVAALTGG